MHPIITTLLGLIALGMVIYVTVREYKRWRRKKGEGNDSKKMRL